MIKARRRLFGASVAAILMTVGLGALTGAGTAAAATYNTYTCHNVYPVYWGDILGNVIWRGGCTGPAGNGPGSIVDAQSGRIYDCQNIEATVSSTYPALGTFVRGIQCQQR